MASHQRSKSVLNMVLFSSRSESSKFSFFHHVRKLKISIFLRIFHVSRFKTIKKHIFIIQSCRILIFFPFRIFFFDYLARVAKALKVIIFPSLFNFFLQYSYSNKAFKVSYTISVSRSSKLLNFLKFS